jgi:hypothetical protein
MEILKDYIKIENIDRKMVKFSKDSKYLKNDQIICYEPELIIIKNENGIILFNKIMNYLEDFGNSKEKGLEYIEDNVEFPYYVISMDMISCGIRWGLWEHYGNDISSLSNEILLEEQQDNFINFKSDIEHLLGI